MMNRRRAVAIAASRRRQLSPTCLWAIATLSFGLCTLRPAQAIVVKEAKTTLSTISLETAYNAGPNDLEAPQAALSAAAQGGTGFARMASIRQFISSVHPQNVDADFVTNSMTGSQHYGLYTTLKWRLGRSY